MAQQQFNAEAGITVGSTPISVIDANGNVSLTGANVSLGNVSNLHITGGSSGYFLQTNGSGNLSWALGGNGISNGTSNVTIPSAGGNIIFSSNGFPVATMYSTTNIGLRIVDNGDPDLIIGSLGNRINAGGSLVFLNDGGPDPANTISTKINNYCNSTATGNTVFDFSGVYNGNGAYARSMMRYDHGTNQWDFFANNSIQLTIDEGNTTINSTTLNVIDIIGDDFTANSLTITSGNTASIAANGLITGATFTSTVATGTAPFTVTSNTVVANLNAATAAVASTISLTGPNANVTNYRFIMSQGTGNQTPVSIQAGQMNYNANTQEFTFGAPTNFDGDAYFNAISTFTGETNWDSDAYWNANSLFLESNNSLAFCTISAGNDYANSYVEVISPFDMTAPNPQLDATFRATFVPGANGPSGNRSDHQPDKIVWSYSFQDSAYANIMSIDQNGNLVTLGTVTQGTP